MKILIAADMEGISGVTTWTQVSAGNSEYERFRSLMTEDVNAAVRGAFTAKADEVFVTDGHASGSNILIEDLDPRASLNTGSPSPLSMMQGVDEVDGVIYVGYHARAGSPDAILDHTWSSKTVANVWLNDILVGEYGINAVVAGHFGVPVLMVTGDQTACTQTVELLGDVETVVVKHATGRYSAECLPPTIAQEMIEKTATQAVARLAKRKAPKPFVLEEPILLSVEFFNSAMADHALRMPEAERDGTCISLSLPDMLTAYNAFRGLVALASG
ncbi:MAG: M55 family metallopeptidase [Anaerolineales bacterium]|jgi:D-amino peptidase